ncbi:MAG TPA: hypothetical protein DE060_11680 [Lentisphaeria bacterium]|nr:hypothetical protein [Lentisphaeria bacterium]HCG49847.1 hypothetical protein [Lentisphaeria bacterium]
MRFPLLLLLFVFCTFSLAAQMTVTRNGIPEAVIVLPEKATLTELFAAEQLSYWVKEITGCALDIAHTPSRTKNNIHIGRSFAESKYPDDLHFLKDSEGFAVRMDNDGLYLFGARPAGCVFAVYDLLEKNTDIIWPTLAAGMDRIFTPVRDLTIRRANYAEKPVIQERAWGINNGYYYNDPRTEYFCLRLKTNAANAKEAPRKRFGFTDDDYECHNLHRYLPWEKYGSEHPEYYCLIDGKRAKPGYHANLCFTAPGSAEEFAGNFIRERLESGLECGIAGIGVEDSNGTCSCKECLAPIRLPGGRILTKEENEAEFRSAQYYMWLNRAAREIKKKHPRVRIATIAYMFATTPPPVPLEDNIIVVYCPINKNLKQDFHGSTNKIPLETLKAWNRLCSSFAVYEYYGCAADYPRPVSYIIQKDLQLMRTMKIYRIYSEWILKNNAEYISAMEFWIVCRLLWNPDQDIEALREEYLRKTFRAAADEMKKFYDIVRDTWYADGASSYYYDNAVKSTGYYLLKDPETEKACRNALNAAVAKADHPISKRLASKILSIFESYVEKAKKSMIKTAKVTIPLIADLSIASVEGGAWANAVEITDFYNLAVPSKKTGVPVSVRVAHDGENIWFKFHAEGVRFPVEKSSGMFSREHWEIFLQTDRANASIPYYHLAFDSDGEKYNAIAFGIKWTHPWKVAVRKNADSWDAVAMVPMKGLNIRGNSAKLHFLHHSKQNKTNEVWKGNQVHEPGAMTDIFFAKEKE